MGNRAVITTPLEGSGEIKDSDNVGVYLHWNGGEESVAAFLEYCRLKEYRSPEVDCYGWARLCQVIGNFFGGELSLGVEKCCCLDCDNGDNGTYVIEKWRIVQRLYLKEPLKYPPVSVEMLLDIDLAQPISERLGADRILAEYAHS